MKNKGFTLIETMISVLIIMMGAVQLSTIIIHSLKYSDRSKKIFQLSEKCSSVKNILLSEKFDSPNLAYSKKNYFEDGFEILININNITVSLKEIEIYIKKDKLSERMLFYKSKYIGGYYE